jgi:hypothetical protein
MIALPKGARTSALLGLGPYVVKHNGGEEWVGLMELTPNHPVRGQATATPSQFEPLP